MGHKALACEKGLCLSPVLIYEEALGYAVSPLVRDKDGVSAAAVLVELACHLHSTGGRSLHAYLSDLRRVYGHFLNNNGYVVASPQQQKAGMAWLVNGGKYRESLGGFRVVSVRDVAAGTDSGCIDGRCCFPKSAGSMLTLRFENGAVLTLRPSGTEPKLKWYGELKATGDPADARKELAQLVKAVTDALPL
ncbi:hypothetical protein Efla_000545 [Eimeria flavescens]